MAQIKLDIRFNRRTMGSLFHSLYLDINDELMIDGECINREYPFDNDIQNLAFVKTTHYPKVFIITPRLRLRFTNWDTIEEAKENLKEGDFSSYQIVVDDETYYIVARAPEDIADFYHPVARLSDEPFDTPFLEETRVHPRFREQKVYVTNATARSAALIAYIYDEQRRGRFERLSNNDVDDYLALFARESSEFARSYNAGCENFSIIENVIDCLTWEQRRELFYESDRNRIIEKLHRHTFHTREDCQYLLRDFPINRDRVLDNSGVFDSENQEDYYFLHVDYLFSLGFKGCRGCNRGRDRITRNWGLEEKRLLLTLSAQMLCSNSLIAKVFKCEEGEIAKLLDEIREDIRNRPDLWSSLPHDSSQEIDVDI